MLLRITTPALVLLLSCGDGCSQPTIEPDPIDTAPDVGHRVVVVVLDGVRLEESLGDGYSDALEMPTDEILPSLRSIIESRGARIEGATATGITITAPGHSDLLTGLRHNFANYPADEGSGAYLPELPSLLSALPEGQAALGTNSALVTPLSDSLSPLSVAPAAIITGDSDRDVLSALQVQMTNSELRLVVINLHQADSQGHNGPPAGYGNKVLDLDPSVASFWAWIQEEPGWQDNTTLVLVADHGRHRREEEEEGWREHGDHCTGCRQIPMALIGAGIQQGVVISATHTLEDLGQTIAYLLDVPMPYGIGSVIDDALETPSGDVGASGAVEPAAGRSLLAWEELTGELDPQSVVLLDDTRISDPDAFAAEAPVIVVSEQATAMCWRELFIDDEEIWPWKPTCQILDASGSWQGIGGPAELVWALWRPALAFDGLALLAGWADNSSGVVMEESSRLVLSRWSPGGDWSEIFATSIGSFPTDPTLALDGEDALLAAALGEQGLTSRSSRRIDLFRINATTGEDELLLRVLPAGAEEDGDHRLDVDRLEHPVLWSGEGNVRLAFISYTIDDDGQAEAALWQTWRTDGVFATPEVLDTGLLGHITPAFDADGILHWIRQTDDGTALCTGLSSDQLDCTALDTEVVRGLAVSEGTVWVSVPGEGRQWEMHAL